jgi:hypothetical protein
MRFRLSIKVFRHGLLSKTEGSLESFHTLHGDSRMNRFRCLIALAATCLLFATSATAQESDSSGEKVVGSSMKMTLQNKLELSGTPVDLEAIEMSSLFGKANIPLHTIAGIRFAQGGDEQTTVVLLNGDALTGDLNLSDIEFVSDWGEAKVNVAHLVSVVFRDDLAWSGVATPNGKRWRLTKLQRNTQRQGGTYTIDQQGRRVFVPQTGRR